MKHNVGNLDRAIRVALAAALFSLFYFLDGGLQWLGLIGLVPLVTAFAGFCPLYTLFGASTCTPHEGQP